jgi:hypothetical protein
MKRYKQQLTVLSSNGGKIVKAAILNVLMLSQEA